MNSAAKMVTSASIHEKIYLPLAFSKPVITDNQPRPTAVLLGDKTEIDKARLNSIHMTMIKRFVSNTTFLLER